MWGVWGRVEPKRWRDLRDGRGDKDDETKGNVDGGEVHGDDIHCSSNNLRALDS